MLKIKIGHPGYTGTNRLAYAKSTAEAVRMLQERGVKRDEARASIDLCFFNEGYGSTTGPIELAVVEGMPDFWEQVAFERQIINRNANLALDVIAEFKREYGNIPWRPQIAQRILRIKAGIHLKPVPREVRI